LPTHLRPTAPIAGDLLLPGDPALALTLAQRLLVKPLMANHSHGLWGYSGATAEGRELTIQATGIGGTSAATVLQELTAHGARRAIRLGTAVALEPTLAPGDRVVVGAALAADRAPGACADGARPDLGLTAALATRLRVAPQTIASFDLWPPTDGDRARRWHAEGAVAADLESAATIALAARLGIAVAAAVVIRERGEAALDEAPAEEAQVELAEAATVALATSAQAAPGGR
jgi:uridine phosphorylase